MIQYFVHRVFRGTNKIDRHFTSLGPYPSPYIAAYVIANLEEIIGYTYCVTERTGFNCSFIYEN